MKKKVKILDENGNDVLSPPPPPSLTKLLKLVDALPVGKVLSVAAAATTVQVSKRQIFILTTMPEMANRYKRIGNKSYLMNPKTLALYEKSAR